MKYRKLLTILLLSVIVATLIACGKNGKGKEVANVIDESSKQETTSQKATVSETTMQKLTEVETTTQKSTEAEITMQNSTEVETTTQKSTEKETTTQKPTEAETITQKSTEAETTAQEPAVEETTIQNPIESEITAQKPTELEVLEWIKANYGNSFKHTYADRWIMDKNGVLTPVIKEGTFGYDPEINLFLACDSVKVHKMVGARKSEIKEVYSVDRVASIETIGAMLGYPGLTYNEGDLKVDFEWSFKLYSKHFRAVSYKKNTEKYFRKTARETSDNPRDNWTFITKEGLPVKIEHDGYIRMDVRYPDETESKYESFTIEEYYDFCDKYSDRCYVTTREHYMFFEENDYLIKTVIIE